MNAAQLIAELSKVPPHTIVRGHNTLVTFVSGDEPEFEITICDDDAQELTDVRWRGHDVCLEFDGCAT